MKGHSHTRKPCGRCGQETTAKDRICWRCRGSESPTARVYLKERPPLEALPEPVPMAPPEPRRTITVHGVTYEVAWDGQEGLTRL